ncbi:MAG: hypothetical protein Q4G68_01365 [Planctomycetia bacterium]|nr:hypothetical protein [Planctomycetia bacterium]
MFIRILMLFGFVLHMFITAESNASEEALELLMKAFQSSGGNPALIHSGRAEFMFKQKNAPSPEIQMAISEAEKSLEMKLKEERKGFSSRRDKEMEEQQQLQKSRNGAIDVREFKMSILMSGNDCYFAANPKTNKRLYNMSEVTTSDSDNKNTIVDHSTTIQIGGPNDMKTCRRFVWRPISNFLECTNQFEEKSEFQLFGRIQELPGSQIAEIFRQKLNRTDFSFEEDSLKYFEQELTNRGLDCEISGEVSYDGSAKATVIHVKKNNRILETYHIDATHGYICPVMFVTDENDLFSTQCTASDYFPVQQNKLYYPGVYRHEFIHSVVGKIEDIYTVVPNSVIFNQPVDSKEFALEIPKGTRVHKRTMNAVDPLLPGTVADVDEMNFLAVTNGTVSFASSENYNLNAMDWLIKDDTQVQYTQLPSKNRDWIRISLFLVGGGMILLGLYYRWKTFPDKNFIPLIIIISIVLFAGCNESIREDSFCGCLTDATYGSDSIDDSATWPIFCVHNLLDKTPDLCYHGFVARREANLAANLLKEAKESQISDCLPMEEYHHRGEVTNHITVPCEVCRHHDLMQRIGR